MKNGGSIVVAGRVHDETAVSEVLEAGVVAKWDLDHGAWNLRLRSKNAPGENSLKRFPRFTHGVEIPMAVDQRVDSRLNNFAKA